MRKVILILVFFVLVALLIAGCGGGTVTCPPEYLIAPSLVSPANWSLVDTLTPTFSWTFPTISYPYPYTGYTCIPEIYRVNVYKGPLFTEKLSFDVAGSITTTTLTEDLEPGTEYAWGVQPFSTGSSDTLEGGMYAGDRYFFTGPVCDAADLMAPTLLQPVNGSTVTDAAPSLIWDYDDDTCRPESYAIELDTSPDFTNDALNGGTGSNPSTRWAPGSSLSECTTYYWRVTPIVGDTWGPVSETFSFSVNIGGGSCTPGTFIAGTVWEEYCSIPDGPLPSPLPFGCVATSDGGATGNGIKDPGEPGIANIQVRLGAGSCPSSDLGVVITDSNGLYKFQGLAPGTYCVSIDVQDNISNLVPGGFTFPSGTTGDIAYHEITLTTDEMDINNNFGWLFQFGPSTPIAMVSGTVYHDECRRTGDTVDAGSEPAGCIRGYDGKLRGNGIFDSDEEGIEGVQVGITQGNCTNTPFAYALTDANGDYYFFVPATATGSMNYCVTVQSATTPNSDVLDSGVWTSPWMYYESVAKRYVSVLAGEENPDRDFGWDYQNLPFYIEPIDIFLYPKFKIDLDTNCRAGPEIRWQSMAILKAGMEFEIEGIQTMGNWILITPSKILNLDEFPDADLTKITSPCWVLKKNGTETGDMTQVQLLEGPPLPTFTPTVTPTFTPTPMCGTYTNILECQANNRCKWTNDKARVGDYCVGK